MQWERDSRRWRTRMITRMPVLWQRLEHTNYQLAWRESPRTASGLGVHRHHHNARVRVGACRWLKMRWTTRRMVFSFTNRRGLSPFSLEMLPSLSRRCIAPFPSLERWCWVKRDAKYKKIRRWAERFPCLHWRHYYPYFCAISLCIVNKS